MAPKNPTTFCLIFLFLAKLFNQVNAVCYFPNGAIAPNDTPCRDDTDNSVCCGQGYACLTNGLCQATGEELQKSGATEFVRGGCTDKTWRSSSCPSFCIENGVDNVGGGTGLAKCPNTDRDIYWCINKNYQSADCDTGVGLLFFPGTPSAITTIGVSPETTKALPSTTWSTLISNPSTIPTSASVAPSSIPSQSPFEGSQPTTSPEPSPDAAPSQVAVIGGAVGGAAAVLILGGLGLWWFLRKRKGRKPVESQITTVPEQHYSSPPKSYGSYTGELYGSTQMPPNYQPTKPVVPYEMSAVQLPQELPATPLHYQRF